jgi:hypothetical protein
MYKDPVHTAQQTSVSIIKTSQLMLYRGKKSLFFSDPHKTNTLCGQNVEL